MRPGTYSGRGRPLATAGGNCSDDDAAAAMTTRLLRRAVAAFLPLLLPAALELQEAAAEERGARQAVTGAARRGRATKGIVADADAVEQLAKPRRAAEAAETSIFSLALLALLVLRSSSLKSARQRESARPERLRKRESTLAALFSVFFVEIVKGETLQKKEKAFARRLDDDDDERGRREDASPSLHSSVWTEFPVPRGRSRVFLPATRLSLLGIGGRRARRNRRERESND